MADQSIPNHELFTYLGPALVDLRKWVSIYNEYLTWTQQKHSKIAEHNSQILCLQEKHDAVSNNDMYSVDKIEELQAEFVAKIRVHQNAIADLEAMVSSFEVIKSDTNPKMGDRADIYIDRLSSIRQPNLYEWYLADFMRYLEDPNDQTMLVPYDQVPYPPRDPSFEDLVNFQPTERITGLAILSAINRLFGLSIKKMSDYEDIFIQLESVTPMLQAQYIIQQMSGI